MACKDNIGIVKQDESTWFSGYNEKYYHDRGALFAAMYGRLAYPILFLYELKGSRSSLKRAKRWKLGCAGMKQYWKTSRCKA